MEQNAPFFEKKDTEKNHHENHFFILKNIYKTKKSEYQQEYVI